MSKEESIVITHINKEMDRFFMRIGYLFLVVIGLCGGYFAVQFGYMMYILFSSLM